MSELRGQLVETSLAVIEQNQTPGGAWVAAPNYDTYRFSWIRDGAFIAEAMDRFGRHESATRFHRWVASTVLRHRSKVDALVEASVDERTTDDPLAPVNNDFVLHTRFTVDGEEFEGPWGNFQLDGYGYWLTSVCRHIRVTNHDVDVYREAIEVAARYLIETWEIPCYDCWEEYPTRQHPTTLAAVAKGLLEAADTADVEGAAEAAAQILRVIETAVDASGALLKFVPANADDVQAPGESRPEDAVAGHERVGQALPADTVDASVLLVLGDFGPFDEAAESVGATLKRIRRDLVVGGGVHRYFADEYYGGGLWIVLAAALAEVLAVRDLDGATESMAWIEKTASPEGFLPEQVNDAMRSPGGLESWIDRWGEPASPLLWSHAMYLNAVAALEADRQSRSG